MDGAGCWIYAGSVELLYRFTESFWLTLMEMGGYLLLGFAVAAVLARFVTASVIRRHLGRGRLVPVLKATLFGIPLPLCSCGVIPVAASLKRHGAHGGSTVAFLASTPQTGVDSILVTYSLMGGLFTLVRVAAALVSGLLSGVLTVFFGERIMEDRDQSDGREAVQKRTWREALRHGFITLPSDIFRPLAVGLLVAAALGVLVPRDLVAPAVGEGLGGKLVMLAVGIPLYVCATASVPVAASFITLGFSPGAALVFLMSGPATNAATIALVWKDLGRRTAVMYLGSIAATAMAAGILLDRLGGGLPPGAMLHAGHVHEESASLLKPFLAVLFLVLMIFARWVYPRLVRRDT